MKAKISLCLFTSLLRKSVFLFIIVGLLLSNTMIWADGKWEIARNDDFIRNDGVEGDLLETIFLHIHGRRRC